MAPQTCAGCRKSLSPEEERRVPAFVKIPASVAMAFMHGGLWAQEELSRPYCARCRSRVSAFAVLITALVLAAAAIGIAVWLGSRSAAAAETSAKVGLE